MTGRWTRLRRGLATDAEIDALLANVAAGDMDLAAAPRISAWGGRPETGDRPGGPH